MYLKERIKLCLRILRFKQSNVVDHAVRELPDDGDEKMQKEMNKCILELAIVFATQRHSGFSAGYAIKALKKVLSFEPLNPLTGNNDEWTEHSCGTFQNIRCSHVFKDGKDLPAYDIEGRVFRDPSGACFTNSDSKVYISFPYIPTPNIIDVPKE